MSRLHKFLHHPVTARFLVTLLSAWGLANVCSLCFFPAPNLMHSFLWCSLFALLMALYSVLRFRFKALLALAAAGGLTALGIWGHTGPVHSLIEGGKAFFYLSQGWTEIMALYAGHLLPMLCLILTIVCHGAAADENGTTLSVFIPAACAILFMLYPQPVLLAASLPAFAGLALQYTRKGHFHIFSLPITALLIALAYLLTPQSPAANPALEETARTIRQVIEDHLLFTSQRDSFSLATEGYLPLQDRLGGKPDISSRPVMDVKTNRTLLLRGKTYDMYTGLSWADSLSAKRYLYHTLYNQGLRDQLFCLSYPLAQKDDLPAEEVQVQMLTDGTTTLFMPAYTREINLQSQRMVLYFNTAAELFLTRNTNSLDRYSFVYTPLQADDADTAQLAEACARVHDPYYATAASQYLALPAHLDDMNELKALATRAADKDASPYGKALQLQAYLQKNYPYSLDVSNPPDGVDFVSYFLLWEQKGYCTYFASAMTVLCRMHGIPARYVTGYLAQPGEDGIAHVTGRDAHAWTEIYLNGIGWLPIDATGFAHSSDGNGNSTPSSGGSTAPTPTPPPASTPKPTAAPQQTPSPTPAPSAQPSAQPSVQPSSGPSDKPENAPEPSAQPSAQPVSSPAPGEDPAPDTESKAFDAWWILLLLALLLAAALWYYLSLPETRAKRKKADAASIYYKALEGVLARMNVYRSASQTLHAFAAQAAEDGYTDAAQAIETYAAHLYGREKYPDVIFRDAYRALFSCLPLPGKIIFRLKGMVGR